MKPWSLTSSWQIATTFRPRPPAWISSRCTSHALAAGTPGLVWNVDGGTAYLVTFDGARYRVDISEDTVKAGEPLAAERDRVKSDRQLEALNDRVRATCKAPRDKMSADLTRIIEERNAARLKLYSDAKAKFGG